MLRKRDGRADTGVSMFIPVAPWCCCGGLRANGFGGPVAPAESRADAEGDGGGRTMLELESVSFWRVDCDVASVECPPRGDEADSAVTLVPSSDCSSGICTLRRGRGPPARRLLDRDGGVKPASGSDEMDARPTRGNVCEVSARLGGGDDVVPLVLAGTAWPAAPSREEERPTDGGLLSVFAGSEWKAARCWLRMDRFSSMGVKMLCCFWRGSFFTPVSNREVCGMTRSCVLDSVLTSMGAGGGGKHRAWSDCCCC